MHVKEEFHHAGTGRVRDWEWAIIKSRLQIGFYVVPGQHLPDEVGGEGSWVRIMTGQKMAVAGGVEELTRPVHSLYGVRVPCNTRSLDCPVFLSTPSSDRGGGGLEQSPVGG